MGITAAVGYAIREHGAKAAIALTLGGIASLAGIAVGFLSWGGSDVRHISATLGLLANAVVLAILISFAVFFHW
jgi:hypothetical protein